MRNSSLFFCAAVACALFGRPQTTAAIDIQPTYVGFTAQQQACAEAAIAEWEAALLDTYTFGDVTLMTDDLGGSGPLAVTTYFGTPRIPWQSTTVINTTVNTHFVAEMQFDHALPVAADKYDGLTIFRHELCHAVGFADWYTDFQANLTAGPGSNRTYNGDGFTVELTPQAQGTHVVGVSDLMNEQLAKGLRKPISDLDLQVLEDAYGYTIPEPTTLALLGPGFAVVVRRCAGRRRRSRQAA